MHHPSTKAEDQAPGWRAKARHPGAGRGHLPEVAHPPEDVAGERPMSEPGTGTQRISHHVPAGPATQAYMAAYCPLTIRTTVTLESVLSELVPLYWIEPRTPVTFRPAKDCSIWVCPVDPAFLMAPARTTIAS